MSHTIRVRDYTLFPGPRYIRLGPYSGEWFRKEVLEPEIKHHQGAIEVDLDGALGYGSSFLDESFAGLLRAGYSVDIVNSIVSKVVSKEDPTLLDEIKIYVEEELVRQRNPKRD